MKFVLHALTGLFVYAGGWWLANTVGNHHDSLSIATIIGVIIVISVSLTKPVREPTAEETQLLESIKKQALWPYALFVVVILGFSGALYFAHALPMRDMTSAYAAGVLAAFTVIQFTRFCRFRATKASL